MVIVLSYFYYFYFSNLCIGQLTLRKQIRKNFNCNCRFVCEDKKRKLRNRNAKRPKQMLWKWKIAETPVYSIGKKFFTTKKYVASVQALKISRVRLAGAFYFFPRVFPHSVASRESLSYMENVQLFFRFSIL